MFRWIKKYRKLQEKKFHCKNCNTIEKAYNLNIMWNDLEEQRKLGFCNWDWLQTFKCNVCGFPIVPNDEYYLKTKPNIIREFMGV